MDDFNGDKPLISVIVTLYNKERYVKRAIDSILAQSLMNFEVVVVDDGCTDNSAEVVAGINDKRIRLIRQENGGEGAARNRGIREAKGDLVAMLDADDEWHSDFLQAVMDLYIAHPEAGIFATGYVTIYSNDFAIETTLTRDVFNGSGSGLVTDYFQFARFANFVWISAQAIPRAVYDHIGMYGENKLGIDLDMLGRVASNYPVAYDVRPLAYYRNDAANRMVPQCVKRPTFPPFVESVRDTMKDNRISKGNQKSLNDYLNRLLFQYLSSVIATGDRQELQRVLEVEFYPSSFHRAELAYLKISSKLMPMQVLYYLERLRHSRYFGFWHFKGGQPVVRRPVRGGQ